MDLLETFVRESDELIDEFEAGLVQLEEADAGAEIVHALFRAAHTLKGNAGMVGLSEFVGYTHVLENVLGRVRDGALAVDSRLIDCLLSAVDVVRAMVHAAARKQPLDTNEQYAATLAVLETFLDPDAAPASAEPLHSEPRDLLVEITLECAPEAALRSCSPTSPTSASCATSRPRSRPVSCSIAFCSTPTRGAWTSKPSPCSRTPSCR
jgi:chemotaxis protein histidine kinase CheA